MSSDSLALPPDLPDWFRLHPTDKEIISYLKLKIQGIDSPKIDRYIAEVDFCKWEPWELRCTYAFTSFGFWVYMFVLCALGFWVHLLCFGFMGFFKISDKSKMESKNGEWLFLCRPDYKYVNSNRSNRMTQKGFWKKTGNEHNTKDCIGRKRVLVFHEGPPPGKKTNWVLHEYYCLQHNVPFRLQV